MTKKQQLYEKSLKKVKKYCLSAAAEKEMTALEALKELKFQVGNIRAGTHDNPPQISSRLVRDMGLFEIIEAALEDADRKIAAYKYMFNEITYYIEKDPFTLAELVERIKAFKIIKKKILDIDYLKVIANNCDLTYQEYELLRKVLEDEQTKN